MRMRRTASWILVSLFITTGAGCTTPYQEEQRALYWQYREGHLSKEEYHSRLEEMRDEQPWGGVGGAKEEAPGSYIYGK